MVLLALLLGLRPRGSRSSRASAPSLRSWRRSQALDASAHSRLSRACPTRSDSASHESPVNRLKPDRGERQRAERRAGEPERAASTLPPAASPTSPPGASGSSAPRLCRRRPRARRSRRAAAANPASAIASGRRSTRRRPSSRAVAPDHQVQAERDPPVGRQPEEIEQEVRRPGADQRRRHCARASVALCDQPGSARWKVDEDEQQVQRERDQDQPLRFAQQAGELCGEGGCCFLLRHRARRSTAHRGPRPGGVVLGRHLFGTLQSACYSGSMMESRSTMFEPRISM